MNPMFPLNGPKQPADPRRLSDYAEVLECRRILGMPVVCGQVEEYGSAADLGAARDLEEWGCNPFEEN